MNNIISRYKAILPVSLFALSAQGVMAQDATEADTINVAFRKADARDVITPCQHGQGEESAGEELQYL